MKLQKIASVFVLACFMLTACKNDAKKTENKTEVVAADTQKVSLNISGMTCEIGCAKTIQSKLAKKEGVLDAKVVFNDSIANIEFDANKVSKTELVVFIDGIAGGDLYKASEKKGHTSCDTDCKKACCANKEKKACKVDCTKPCCAKKDTDKKACEADCKKACCTTDKKA